MMYKNLNLLFRDILYNLKGSIFCKHFYFLVWYIQGSHFIDCIDEEIIKYKIKYITINKAKIDIKK